MTALLTLSHGSRHPRAAAGIDRLTAVAGERLGVTARAAHLEFNSPSLIDAAASLAAAGHRRAVVVPLLFTDGFHARHDVPAALQAAQELSGLDLLPARGLGTGEDIAEVLAAHTRPAPGRSLTLAHVGSSDPTAEEAVGALAQRVAARLGRQVGVRRATGDVTYGETHLIPLFVTEALLLDRLLTPGVSADPPLGAALADIVAARYRAALT
ncbi:MAG: CbiX/SirB N-terminal domain-containing protein [Corynebacterium sp.]|uniref:sirohydrochlorin chelatase n=1 Tax=Corynebacterium sp. TaxID=1720 RepID=UPI0026DEEA32|nr:CbiX/SirB N-terminal domain-containing protein [Corynebacterium sp.]MDO5670080.1 CbiX/SirB N-terminal domain-containing protein [Corynebacterium sp.]